MKKMFAAIDVGSTSLAMKVAALSKKDGIQYVDDIKYPLLLGAETYTVGKIRYRMVENICGVMEEFVRIMREYGVEEYAAYATTAVREAANSEYIIDRINLRTGLKVNILSNEEEHFLQNKALALYDAHFAEMIETGAVILDVSSGRVQASVYEKSELKFSQSIPLGSLRVAEQMSRFERSSIKYTGLVKEYISNGLRRFKNDFFETADAGYFILSGSFVEYIKVLCGKEGEDFLSYSDIEEAYAKIADMPVADIAAEYGLTQERAYTLHSTIMFFLLFMEYDKTKKIFVTELSLRDGMVVEYLEKQGYTHTQHRFTEDIISSAKFYADKYRCDKTHYETVNRFADEIFKVMSKKFGLSKRDKVLLNVAAIMADTGYFVNANNYSKYSYDVVSANHILGLSDKEVKTIAYTVLFHASREPLDGDGYETLTKSHRLQIAKLTAILSLAKSLDCGYNGKIRAIKSGFKKESMYVRAYSDDDIEIERLEFEAAADFFEDVFGLRPVLIKSAVK